MGCVEYAKISLNYLEIGAFHVAVEEHRLPQLENILLRRSNSGCSKTLLNCVQPLLLLSLTLDEFLDLSVRIRVTLEAAQGHLDSRDIVHNLCSLLRII